MDADASERAYRQAIACGITHVDFHPGIERDGVARVLADTDASKLFLTTKIRKPPVGATPADAAKMVRVQLEEDLSRLGVPRVDMLMLRDSPAPEVMQAQWAEVERAKASGLTRSVGVVNYCERSLGCILQTAKEAPAINYYMLHVGMGADAGGLRTYCDSRGIKTFAYGALGEPAPSAELLSSEELRKIGAEHGGRSAEEVALRWVLQSGAACSVRPTTSFGLGFSVCDAGAACAAGLRARSAAFGWSLTAAEMRQLSQMTSPAGNPTLFSSTGCPNSFFAAK
uniref:NADP-dependent oxidoreductase domain-containing protein n=1 Tax=Calcidiscus leptoporus TaxID=127549 RepID=A0A7S0J460_9EUKA